MKILDFSEPSCDGRYDLPRLLEDVSEKTEALDIVSWFSPDITSAGSFNIRGGQRSSLGRLLDALPIPVLLRDGGQTIFVCNQASDRLSPDPGRLLGAPYSEILIHGLHCEVIRSHLNKVYSYGTPKSPKGVSEQKIVGIGPECTRSLSGSRTKGQDNT